MRVLKLLGLSVLASAPLLSRAALVTVEPDDYAPGTDLTGISSYVSITTTAGGCVRSTCLSGERVRRPAWRDDHRTLGRSGVLKFADCELEVV